VSAHELADILRGALADSKTYLPTGHVETDGDDATTVILGIGSWDTDTGIYRVHVTRENTNRDKPASADAVRALIASALPSLRQALSALQAADGGTWPVDAALTALSQAVVILAPAVTP
jgi:hypothetical protein